MKRRMTEAEEKEYWKAIGMAEFECDYSPAKQIATQKKGREMLAAWREKYPEAAEALDAEEAEERAAKKRELAERYFD